jgi:hypothetical protein
VAIEKAKLEEQFREMKTIWRREAKQAEDIAEERRRRRDELKNGEERWQIEADAQVHTHITPYYHPICTIPCIDDSDIVRLPLLLSMCTC